MENLEKQSEQPEQIDLEQLREKRDLLYEYPDKYERIVSFAEGLKKKYSDWNDYKLYHFLISSTPAHKLPKMDFPGEDSVKNFIESLSV